LTIEDEDAKSVDWIEFDEDSIDTLMPDKFSVDIEPEKRIDEPEYKEKGFLGSFELLIWEQLPRWPWYLLMLLGCLGAGGKF
jgi:hypothetical protein